MDSFAPSRFIVASALLVASSGCAEPPSVCTPDVVDAIDPAVLRAHLDAFADIADEHGDRASGTPGYDASVDYVMAELEELGLSPERQVFEHELFAVLGPVVVEATGPGGTESFVEPEIILSHRADSGTAEGPVIPVGDGLEGCGACDLSAWADFPVGGIAIVRADLDDLGLLLLVSQTAGVGALLVEVEADLPEPPFDFGTPTSTPLLIVGRSAGERLRAADSVRLDVNVDREHVVSSTNVLVELPGEAPVSVMIGAHLDSVPGSPGVNDNGTGVASVLEIARALTACDRRRGVRVAFWGAEEWGILGSRHWVDNAEGDQLSGLEAYLNLDMVGSPNGGTFVLGGAEEEGLGARLHDWYEERGVPNGADGLDGNRSDFRWFRDAGVPVTGIAARAEQPKTEEEVVLFGGEAGRAYDECYHRPCDERGNVNEPRMLRAAEGIGWLAQYLVTRAL